LDDNRSGRLLQADSFPIVRLCCRLTVMRWQIVGSRSPQPPQPTADQQLCSVI